MNRVLVVDDEAGMRTALEAHFLRREWRVDTAANAVEAMEKFRQGLHPLVVTDIRMPGPRGIAAGLPQDDGFSVMRQARILAPHTAVILLTAFANVPDAVAAMKGGACDYLVKPVAFERLEEAAERILQQARIQSQAAEALVGHAPAWLRALDRARQRGKRRGCTDRSRERHGKRAGGAADPSLEPAARCPLRRHQLFSLS